MLEENKAVIRRFVEELYEQGKLDVANEIIHPNTRSPRPGATWTNGPESVRESIADSRRGASDLKRQILDMVAEGDRVVLYSRLTGTHTGPNRYLPFPATGVKLTLTGVAAFQIEDGKIIEEPWSNWNFAELVGPPAKAHVRRWFDRAWSSRNPETIRSFLSEDYQGHIFGGYPGRTGRGVEAVVALFEAMWAAFPDLEVSVQDQMFEGDKISSRIVMSGTPTREFFGYKPSGKRVSREGVMTFRLERGKFAEGWATWGPFVDA